jgi:MFS family permease
LVKPDVRDDTAPSSTVRTFALLFLAVGIFQCGTGMLVGVVPVQLSLNGFSASVVGWVSTGQAIGFLAGSLLAAPLIAVLRTQPTMVLFASINAAAAIILWISTDAWIWTAARTLAGFSSGCVLVLIEGWVASKATPGRRGLIFGVYMLLSRLAFMVAQLTMAAVTPQITVLFLVAALCYLAAPGVAFFIPGASPVIGAKSIAGFWQLPRRAPAAAAGALTHAFITTAALSLFPVYAVARSVPVEQIAFLLAATQFGGLVLQLPLSLLSDRMGRRTVMVICAIGTTVMSLLLWLVQAADVWTLAAMVAIWAGAPAALYSLSVAHANDVATDAERIAWSGAMLSLWGAGAVVGPIVAAALMDRFGVAALFVFTGTLSSALVVFLILRKLIRKRPVPPISSSATIGPAPGAGG